MIEELLVLCPSVSQDSVSQAHFLRYQNCLFHRELEGARDNLHRYFDLAAEFVQNNKRRTAAAGAADSERKEERSQVGFS